jgi:hypothetical protein
MDINENRVKYFLEKPEIHNTCINNYKNLDNEKFLYYFGKYELAKIINNNN